MFGCDHKTKYADIISFLSCEKTNNRKEQTVKDRYQCRYLIVQEKIFNRCYSGVCSACRCFAALSLNQR